jgi:hypothetical protein
MQINLGNIEQIIFQNSAVFSCLPELKPFLGQWKISQSVPGMRDMGKRAALNLMNILDDNMLSRISDCIGEDLSILRTSDKLVENISCDVEKLESYICNYDGFTDLCVYRDGENVEITLWR